MLIAWVKMSDGLQCRCTHAVMEKWYKNCSSSSSNSSSSFNQCVPGFQTRCLSSRELSVLAHWIYFNEPEPAITYYMSALVWAHRMHGWECWCQENRSCTPTRGLKETARATPRSRGQRQFLTTSSLTNSDWLMQSIWLRIDRSEDWWLGMAGTLNMARQKWWQC